jgi:MFS transporter, putative metabolite:H+ symporter
MGGQSMAQSIEGFINSAMDDARMSGAHWRAIALITAGLFFDVLDLAIFGGLVPDMVKEHFLVLANVPMVVTGVLLGLFIGSASQGELTDRFGRKKVYQWSLLLYGFATIACAFAPDYYWLTALRFVAGLGLGTEIALTFAYAAEFSPRKVRGRNMALVQLGGGALPWPAAIILALAFRQTLGWRGIFALIGVFALVVWALRFSLPESPRWLATHGRGAQALKILPLFDIAGPAPGTELTTTPASDSKSDPLVVVFTTYRRRVVMAMLAFFCFFGVATILGTFMPSIMASRGFAITKALQFTLGMTLSYPLSSLFMVWALDRIGRIRTAVGAFILAGIFSVVFSQSATDTMILVTGFCMFFFQQLGGNSLTMFTSEIFPTNARATGAGLAVGTGRVGAVASSYGIVALLTYGMTAVFAATAGLLVVAAAATLLMGRETKGVSLDVIAPPTG